MADLDTLYLNFLTAQREAMVEFVNLERDITLALAKEASRLPYNFDAWVMRYNELSDALLGFVRTDRTPAVVRLRIKLKGYKHADPAHQEATKPPRAYTDPEARLHRRTGLPD